MKKKLLSILVAFVATSMLAAAALPEFPDDETAIVFDTKTLKDDWGDGIKFVNLTTDDDITFQMYATKNPKKGWEYVGETSVSGAMTSVDVESQLSKDVDDYRYYALINKTDKAYKVDMYAEEISMYVISKETLVFTISPTEETPIVLPENASIIEVATVKGKFKDNVKLVNNSSDSGIKFIVFGAETEEGPWEIVGSSELKSTGDQDFVKTPIASIDIKKCKFYAVSADNGNTYTLSGSTAHSDLYIAIK